jgi:hypothetical protein
MKRLVLLVALLAFAAPASASSGKLTLHPSGFGTKSYSAWKAKQGLPDTKGNDDQALYFQKMTTTPTFAAGVAVVKGIAGTPAQLLTGLAWDHREDGHCGAGAPRWNVNLTPNVGGPTQTVFLGCNAATHAEVGSYGGHDWCRDTQPSPATEILAQTGQSASDFTIAGLAIIFDEGNDTPNPPPTGCGQEQLAGGFVHLDNITVELNGETHCWSGANDNGAGGASSCPAVPTQASAAAPIDLGVTVPAGFTVDPTDVELVNALGLAYPGVALTAWRLYPNVIY